MSDNISRQAVLNYPIRLDRYDAEHGNRDFVLGIESVMDYVESLPSAEPKIDDENELKFYYVESLDDYWVGRRLDYFYYANWHEGLGFVWSHSRHLPWGEHIVDENALWKEHTYPSEPIEIPFTEWIVGFVKKYFAEPKTGECRTCKRNADNGGIYEDGRTKCPIQEHYVLLKDGYCHLYELRMRGEQDDKR